MEISYLEWKSHTWNGNLILGNSHTSLGDKCVKIPQFEGAVVCDQEGPHRRHIALVS